MTTTDPAKALAREIADLKRQVHSLSRGSQAARRSFEVAGQTVSLPEIAATGASAKIDAADARRKAEEATTAAQGAATQAESAESAALEAAGIAATKGRIVYTTSEPEGDEATLWIPPPSNIPHRWNGETWETVESSSIQAAADAAVSAEAAADAARQAAQDAQNWASEAGNQATLALTTATGKNTVTYSESAPTAATPGIRAGDIWFQRPSTGTQMGVITGSWEWSGTAWLSRTFGDAVLNSLTVGKLTAGVMNADVVVGGRFSTYFSPVNGWREVNSKGFQAWDPGGQPTISLDGVSNLLTGWFRTAVSGRRIEMGAGGYEGFVNFYAPNNARTYIRSWTEPNGLEALQLGVGDPSSANLQNRINMNTQAWTTMSANRLTLTCGDYFNIMDGSADMSNAVTVYYTKDGEHFFNDGYGNRFSVTEAFGGRSEFFFPSSGSGGSAGFHGAGFGTSSSPILRLSTGSNQAANIKLWADGNGNYFEFKDWTDSVWYGIRAGAFVVPSDADHKDDIQVFTGPALDTVRSTAVHTYNRKAVAGPGIRKSTVVDEDGNEIEVDEVDPDIPARPGDQEIGLIAQEAPSQIVVTDSSGRLGIDLYQSVAMLWAAVSELADRIDPPSPSTSPKKAPK